MRQFPLKAKFRQFSLNETHGLRDTVIVPSVKGTALLKYGKHAYYFYNFKTGKCVCVEIKHLDIIKPGLPLFIKALKRKNTVWTKLKLFFERFHYGFNFLEQIMLMTVPHTVVSTGNGKFIVNLWSYVGYLEIDCRAKTVLYVINEERHQDNQVLGSQQWYDHDSDELYYMTYSLPESLRKKDDPFHPVSGRVLKDNRQTGATQEIWSGPLTDYLHDIQVNKTRRYCVVCELGMFLDRDENIIPSKVLVIDMKHRKEWIISRFIVAAHTQFDPEDPDVIYFSSHNFKFVPSSYTALLRNATYSIKFNGPASVFKYRLASDGPQEIGVFTDPNMFRLTNFQVFMHRGNKILAAMGFPNFIYFVDANTMTFIKKIEVSHGKSYKYLWKNDRCVIGTLSPSSDGEKLFVQTTRSFQIIDIERGTPDHIRPLFFNHSCANHMQTASDTDW